MPVVLLVPGQGSPRCDSGETTVTSPKIGNPLCMERPLAIISIRRSSPSGTGMSVVHHAFYVAVRYGSTCLRENNSPCGKETPVASVRRERSAGQGMVAMRICCVAACFALLGIKCECQAQSGMQS